MTTKPENDVLAVRIAVLTYQRPGDIGAALPLLETQAASIQNASIHADVMVVDNDPGGSARELVQGFAARARVPVHYESETVPGISAARNRALDAAQGIDLLVFIDDDERPGERWLSLLVDTWREYRCAAVVGPVISEYEVEPDDWIRSGRFFNRRRMPTGSKVDVAATNNLLLDLSQIDGLRFDPFFGLTGGGDTMFTRTLHRRGGVMIWCDEAIVIDVVPAARATRDWVLRRAFRSGSSWSVTSIKLADTTAERTLTRVRLTWRGLIRVLGGAAQVCVGAVGGSMAHRARGQRTIARGAGMLSGVWGFVYAEYKRTN